MERMTVLFVALFLNFASTQLVKGQHGKDCQTNCGNVSIIYPFGTSPSCHYSEDPTFKVTCDKREKRLSIFDGIRSLEVINISRSGELRVWMDMVYTCYNNEGNVSEKSYRNYTLGSFSLSEKNKLTLVGCNAFALVSTFGMREHATGCLSLCNSPSAENVGCKGGGCCTTEVSPLLGRYEFEIDSVRLDGFPSVHDFNPCTYAFLAENGTFKFDPLRDMKNLGNVTRFPVVLDWSVGEVSCNQVGNASICSGNATCVDATRGKGYNCQCLQGYHGNPYYTPLGCKDMDECSMGRHNCSRSSTCENTLGSFRCKCPSGQRLDTSNMSCKTKDPRWPTILLGTIIGFLVILLGLLGVQQRLETEEPEIQEAPSQVL
ncbi:unnamed protein product [Microthlaspi erraticum]|uniref:EGF-like domain-containing protein n=1 Tax=Microthlaspi erraticum TaxID=1685480 RepID=A0A6D2K0Z3_9BRAS|nr:unnamed protein product [Microthlaspi erraticum]